MLTGLFSRPADRYELFENHIGEVQTVPATRLKEFDRIEQLLYGINYAVHFSLYGPADSDLGLVDALKFLIADDCEIFGVTPSSPQNAMAEMMRLVLYEGDDGSGPLELASKKTQVIQLMHQVFSVIGMESADMVIEFAFKDGHPAYPVFWDFAFDIHLHGQRWILVGSSSD